MYDDHDELVELVKAHHQGVLTIRQIAQLTGLTPDEAFEAVEKIYAEHDLGDHDGDTNPTTFTPDDF